MCGGEAGVVLGGGVGLAVGAGVSLVKCVLASMPAFLGLDIYGVMAVALVTAVCAGAINGFLVGYLRLSSLIATFATGAIWFGMALALIPQPGGEIPEIGRAHV